MCENTKKYIFVELREYELLFPFHKVTYSKEKILFQKDLFFLHFQCMFY